MSAPTNDRWNPHWIAFAASKGWNPEFMPPGPSVNAEFMAWISEQAEAFTAETGISRDTHTVTIFHERFSDWLVSSFAPQPWTLAL